MCVSERKYFDLHMLDFYMEFRGTHGSQETEFVANFLDHSFRTAIFGSYCSGGKGRD